MRAVFLTYNAVLGAREGWNQGANGRSAMVLQSETFAIFTSQGGQVAEAIDGLWAEMAKDLSQFDTFVIYIGTQGSERAIELARQLDPAKVVFVLCDCSLRFKIGLIEKAGLGAARRVMCECRGVTTMGRLLAEFLTQGTLTG